jgi:hypothetical protein
MMIEVKRSTHVADLSFTDSFEEMESLAILSMVADCLIAPLHLHVAFPAFPRVPEGPVRAKLVGVAVLGS